MELRSQFEQFLRDIRPSERNREEWKMGSRTLRSRLLRDPDLSALIVSSFLQGSVRRSTAVRPTGGKRSDVDVVIVTTIDHGAEAPILAMKRFEPFLERHYAGKWTRQDRSFAIELSYVDLDLVVTALPLDPAEREEWVEIYKSDAVETTASLEERSDWQLSKRWNPDQNAAGDTAFLIESADPDTDWKSNPLMLPDRVPESWGETHPLAQIQWTAGKNRRCNGHYVSVVRATKWWRHENGDKLPKYPKGYPLEHMIGHVLPDGIESVAQGLTLAFEGIRDTFRAYVQAGRVPVLCDHGVPSHDVMRRVEPSDFAAFHAAATSAADVAREALESQDAVESGELWRRLLGNSLPLPGPGGGDRPRGFTPPARPATPKTDRFA